MSADVETAARMLERAQSFVDRTCPGCKAGGICMPGHLGLGTFDACRILLAARDLLSAEIDFRQTLQDVRKVAS